MASAVSLTRLTICGATLRRLADWHWTHQKRLRTATRLSSQWRRSKCHQRPRGAKVALWPQAQTGMTACPKVAASSRLVARNRPSAVHLATSQGQADLIPRGVGHGRLRVVKDCARQFGSGVLAHDRAGGGDADPRPARRLQDGFCDQGLNESFHPQKRT